MYGSLLEKIEVKVPASKAWGLYDTLELGKVVAEHVVERLNLVDGDGGVGTILKLTFKPGFGFSSYNEKLTKIDNANKVKETEVVEGGYLDLGFTIYRVKFEVKDNPKDNTGSSCLVKSIIEYEVKEEFAANASIVMIQPVHVVMTDANEFLLKSN